MQLHLSTLSGWLPPSWATTGCSTGSKPTIQSSRCVLCNIASSTTICQQHPARSPAAVRRCTSVHSQVFRVMRRIMNLHTNVNCVLKGCHTCNAGLCNQALARSRAESVAFAVAQGGSALLRLRLRRLQYAWVYAYLGA